MSTTAAIVIALLVVLFLVVAYKMGWLTSVGKSLGIKSAFVNAHTGQVVPKPYQGGDYNPYTVLNKRLATIRGTRPNDAYNQVPFYKLPGGLAAYQKAGATYKPRDISKNERAQWYAESSAISPDSEGFASSSGQGPHYRLPGELDSYHKAGATYNSHDISKAEQQQWHPESSAMTHSFNPETAHEGFTSPEDASTPGAGINYDDYVTDLVVDPRTRDNHRKWVEEMKPWSGVAMKVDNLDMADYVDFHGLRRPPPVVQYNPLQLTEIDGNDLSVNKPFNFNG